MNKKLLLIPLSALLVAGGAIAGAQVTSKVPPPSEPLPAAFQEATIVEEWCELMNLAHGPDVAVPDVQTSFADAQVGAVATPETAFVALLEGIPAAIELPWATLRVAGEQLIDEEPVTNPAEVNTAAIAVDLFMDTSCVP